MTKKQLITIGLGLAKKNGRPYFYGFSENNIDEKWLSKVTIADLMETLKKEFLTTGPRPESEEAQQAYDEWQHHESERMAVLQKARNEFPCKNEQTRQHIQLSSWDICLVYNGKCLASFLSSGSVSIKDSFFGLYNEESRLGLDLVSDFISARPNHHELRLDCKDYEKHLAASIQAEKKFEEIALQDYIKKCVEKK